MHEFFDTINVYLLHHPELLTHLRWLFWFKSWCLILLMGVFLFLVYREEGRQRTKRRNIQHRCMDHRWIA